ncbi:hypothetical protein ACQP2U_42580 (plasmid) [Nocardia sp. CA-084685]|uniref:hypothetical protein n=1 Tax=Nocardia sp. CA-084685 TaxID=3239970 RepID=UPI003D964A51
MQRDEYRYWSSDKRFRDLVAQLTSLQLGSWDIAEVEAAVSTLGWQLRPVVPARAVDPALWTTQIVDWTLDPGPRAGVATVMAANTDPRQAVLLTVNLSQGIDFDMDYNDGPEFADVEFTQSAWSILEEMLGAPATSWSGLGPRMLWERPDTNLALRLDRDQVVLEMMCMAFDSDARQEPRPLWHAVESATTALPAARATVTNWDHLRDRLSAGLRALCSDAPRFPATFRVHLRSAADPTRYVSAWNVHHVLGIECPVNATDSTETDQFAALGWMRFGDVWRQWFDNARFEPQQAKWAAARLVGGLRTQRVELADMSCHGLIDGRDRVLPLDLPELGIARYTPDACAGEISDVGLV